MIENAYEYDLIKMAKEGNKESQEEFIRKNKGLVHIVVKKFLNRGTECEDLVQLGMMGLYKAMKNFNLDYDVKFSTYAIPVITGEIRRFLRDDGIIKISRNIKELALKIKLRSESFEKEFMRAPTISEISDMLSVSKEDIVLALNSTEYVSSLYDNVGNDDNSVMLVDKIEDKNAQSEETLVDKIALKEMLAHLKPRERQVIVLRYFKEMTQENIAKLLGISQVQVCRIEKKVLGILRNKFNFNE